MAVVTSGFSAVNILPKTPSRGISTHAPARFWETSRLMQNSVMDKFMVKKKRS